MPPRNHARHGAATRLTVMRRLCMPGTAALVRVLRRGNDSRGNVQRFYDTRATKRYSDTQPVPAHGRLLSAYAGCHPLSCTRRVLRNAYWRLSSSKTFAPLPLLIQYLIYQLEFPGADKSNVRRFFWARVPRNIENSQVGGIAIGCGLRLHTIPAPKNPQFRRGVLGSQKPTVVEGNPLGGQMPGVLRVFLPARWQGRPQNASQALASLARPLLVTSSIHDIQTPPQHR